MLGLHCCTGFSLVAASGGYSQLRCADPSLRWLLLLRSTVSRASVVAACGLRGCCSQAQYLWHAGLVALWHVGSSRTRDGTRVSCIGKQVLYHWATREASLWLKFLKYLTLTCRGREAERGIYSLCLCSFSRHLILDRIWASLVLLSVSSMRDDSYDAGNSRIAYHHKHWV